MSQGDQLQLFNVATRVLTIARRKSDPRTVDYWSCQPIVSLEVLPYGIFCSSVHGPFRIDHESRLPLIRLPMEKSLSVLSQRRSDVTPILAGMTDPFLYNPRKTIAGQVTSSSYSQSQHMLTC